MLNSLWASRISKESSFISFTTFSSETKEQTRTFVRGKNEQTKIGLFLVSLIQRFSTNRAESSSIERETFPVPAMATTGLEGLREEEERRCELMCWKSECAAEVSSLGQELRRSPVKLEQYERDVGATAMNDTDECFSLNLLLLLLSRVLVLWLWDWDSLTEIKLLNFFLSFSLWYVSVGVFMASAC